MMIIVDNEDGHDGPGYNLVGPLPNRFSNGGINGTIYATPKMLGKFER